MKIRSLLLIVSLSLFFESAQSETITWKSVVDEVINSNLELKSATNSVTSSKYQIKGARSGFLPQISASAGYNYDSTSLPKYYSTSLTATENLFSGFSDTNKVNQAKLVESSAEVNLESVKSKISFDLKSAFMGLIFSQKNIKLTEDIIKRREANLRLVQLRFESGRENIGSLHLSKAYLSQAKLEHLQAMNANDVYQSQMNRVLGRDDLGIFEVEGEIPVINPNDSTTIKLDYKKIANEIPDYKKAYLTQKIAQNTIDLSQSAFYPVLNLTESISRSGRESSATNNSWVIGAAIVFPLFSGGKDYYTFKSATEDYRASVLNLKNTEDTSMTKLKQSYSAYIEAVMKYEVDQAFELAAISRERIAKAQYNNGLITFTDWDIIENDLIQRQKTSLQSSRERVIAEASWEQAQGKGVIP